MAHDLLFKDSSRNWGRGNSASKIGDVTICTAQPRPKMGWFGYTMAATFATRILSGRWPWYWFGQAANRLEGKGSR